MSKKRFAELLIADKHLATQPLGFITSNQKSSGIHYGWMPGDSWPLMCSGVSSMSSLL